ncbi:MAG TPA: PRC-barrel domain-containing protein [Desulfopila sp.]|nr:PRC-barrel domain-containing protein [Desulfopila sp.]
MDRKLWAVLTVAMAVIAAGPGHAQNASDKTISTKDQESQQTLTGTAQQTSKDTHTIGLEGLPVTTPTGKKIGEMKGITVDKQTNRIHFFSFTPQDGKTVLLPYGSLRMESDRAVMLVPTEKISSAPMQQNRTDEAYLEDLQSYYGIAPTWGDANSQDREKQ